MLEKIRNRIKNWMNPKEKCPADNLYNLLFGHADKWPTSREIEAACGLDIAKRPVQVATIRVGDGSCDPEKLEKIVKLCSGSSDSDEVLSVFDGCNQVILLLFRDTLWEDQAREILEDIQKSFLSIWPRTRLYITLGSVEDYVEEGEPAWRKSYKIAIGLQDYRYVKPKGKIIAYSDIVSRRQRYPKSIHFRFDLLKEFLEDEDPKLLTGWISDIYSILPGDNMDTIGLRYHLTLEIIVNTVSLFREKGLYAEAYIQPPEVLIGEVLCIETPLGLQQWAECFLQKCREILRNS